MTWFALAAVVFAAALVAGWQAIGTTTVALGVVGMVFLLAIAVWLFVDAVIDIFKTREHITIDIVRILALGLLGASLVAADQSGCAWNRSGRDAVRGDRHGVHDLCCAADVRLRRVRVVEEAHARNAGAALAERLVG